MQFNKRRLTLAALVPAGIFLLILPLVVGQYYQQMAALAGIGVILALGMNIFFGYCGQINFGASGFYALGAYSAVLLQTRLHWHFFIALPAAVVITGVFAYLVGIPILRLRGHTLALGTLSFGLVVFMVIEAMVWLTGGGDGIYMPKLFLFGHRMREMFDYYLVLVFAVLSYLACHYLVSSRVGRAMKAIREDETAALAMGIKVARYKSLAWVLNGVFGGLAGVLFLKHSGWICPTYFEVWTSIIILVMVVFGGTGSNLGAVVGGAIIMILPQALSSFREYRVLVNGAILVLILVFMPKGIVGSLKGVVARLGNSKKKATNTKLS